MKYWNDFYRRRIRHRCLFYFFLFFDRNSVHKWIFSFQFTLKLVCRYDMYTLSICHWGPFYICVCRLHSEIKRFHIMTYNMTHNIIYEEKKHTNNILDSYDWSHTMWSMCVYTDWKSLYQRVWSFAFVWGLF